jgi:hypothetical protein
MKRIPLALCLLAALALAASGEEKKAAGKKEEKKKEDRYFALLDGDVYTVTGPVLEETDVLTKNGTIFRIGKDLHIPEEAEILEVKGMRVYPGLVAVSSYSLLGAEPPDNSTDVFGLNLVLGLAGGLTTVVTGNTAAKLTYGTTEGMVLKRNVFTALKYSRRSPDQRRKLREEFERVRKYIHELSVYERKKADGVKDLQEPDKKWLKGNYEKYYKLMKGEAIAKMSASSTQDLRDACDLATRFGFRLVIDGAEESWIVADEIGRAGAQVILSPRAKRRPSRRLSRPTGTNIETARILYESGVNFAILPSSRGISLGGITGRDLMALPLEAAFAVRGGLTGDAAVRAITIDAARLLGLEGRIGSIEEGKDADFIVCDGDLLHYNTLVQWTVVNGKVAYDKQDETLFAHIRPRDGSDSKRIEFWPRPFGEMPQYFEEEGEGEEEEEEKADG